MHTMWGVRQGDKNHLYPLSPMETTGAAGVLGLSGPCLLAEPRPSGLWIPNGLRPSLPSGTSLVPRTHRCWETVAESHNAAQRETPPASLPGPVRETGSGPLGASAHLPMCPAFSFLRFRESTKQPSVSSGGYEANPSARHSAQDVA